jgi:hypothetical protein
VNQTKLVYAPETAGQAIIDMQYQAVNINKLSVGDLTFTIDFDMDGSEDYTGTLAPTFGRIKHEEFTIQEGTAGQLWSFNIIGEGFKIVQPVRDRNYVELRIEYAMNVQFVLGGGTDDSTDSGNNSQTVISYAKYPAILAPLDHGHQTMEYTGGTVLMPRNYYDLTKVVYYEPEEEKPEAPKERTQWWPILLVLLIALLAVYLIKRRRSSKID